MKPVNNFNLFQLSCSIPVIIFTFWRRSVFCRSRSRMSVYHHFQQYFSYIMSVCFIGEGN